MRFEQNDPRRATVGDVDFFEFVVAAGVGETHVYVAFLWAETHVEMYGQEIVRVRLSARPQKKYFRLSLS